MVEPDKVLIPVPIKIKKRESVGMQYILIEYSFLSLLLWEITSAIICMEDIEAADGKEDQEFHDSSKKTIFPFPQKWILM